MTRAINRYWAAVAGLSVFFLLLFFVFDALNVPLLQDPQQWLGEAGIVGALLGMGLLIADVVLPVPSSIVMVANGTMFGLLGGALLSLAGRAGAFLFGYYLGAKSQGFARRHIPESQMNAAHALIETRGALAIILTRPVPILSETMSIVAGLASLPLGKSLFLAILGSVPEALLLAATGAYAATLDNTFLVFGALLLVTGLYWAASRRRKADVAATVPARNSASAAPTSQRSG